MVRQIASQPLIPCLIDFVDRAQFGICAHGSIDDSNDPEVDTVKVRIGAEMIADNNHPFRFQITECQLDLISPNPRPL